MKILSSTKRLTGLGPRAIRAEIRAHGLSLLGQCAFHTLSLDLLPGRGTSQEMPTHAVPAAELGHFPGGKDEAGTLARWPCPSAALSSVQLCSPKTLIATMIMTIPRIMKLTLSSRARRPSLRAPSMSPCCMLLRDCRDRTTDTSTRLSIRCAGWQPPRWFPGTPHSHRCSHSGSLLWREERSSWRSDLVACRNP